MFLPTESLLDFDVLLLKVLNKFGGVQLSGVIVAELPELVFPKSVQIAE